ncbi:MAG TPA: phenylacetate--CoA ligase, partial [Clostridiales bacterium]|nr:phenylacetate--CoA ligase [Clostridiales bacterium]
LMELGYPSHYQIIVDRINNTDTMNVNVEMLPEQFSDKVSVLEGREQQLTEALKSLLGIYVKVHLVAPRTIVRSEGKAIRVIDNRKLF